MMESSKRTKISDDPVPQIQLTVVSAWPLESPIIKHARLESIIIVEAHCIAQWKVRKLLDIDKRLLKEVVLIKQILRTTPERQICNLTESMSLSDTIICIAHKVSIGTHYVTRTKKSNWYARQTNTFQQIWYFEIAMRTILLFWWARQNNTHSVIFIVFGTHYVMQKLFYLVNA